MKLFAGLRERAGTGERELDLPTARAWRTSGPRSASATSPTGSSTPSTASYARADRRPRRRRRGRARSRRSRAGRSASARPARPRRGRQRRWPTTRRARSRPSPARCAGARAGATCSTSSTRPTQGWPRTVMAEIAAELAERYDVIRAVAIHHRVGRVEIGEASVVIAVSAPHRADALAACARRDRRAQGARPALEEGGLRGRRGVDRPWLVARGIVRPWPITPAGAGICFGATQLAPGERVFVLVDEPLEPRARELVAAARDAGAEAELVLWAGRARRSSTRPSTCSRPRARADVGFHLQQAPRGEEGAARFEVLRGASEQRQRPDALPRLRGRRAPARRAVAAHAATSPRPPATLLAQLEGAREIRIRAPGRNRSHDAGRGHARF